MEDSTSFARPSNAGQATINSLEPAERDMTDDRLRELKFFTSQDPI
jgi:hypothetical protein